MQRDLWFAQQTLFDSHPQPLEVRVFVGVDPDGSVAHATYHVVSVPGEKLMAAWASSFANANAFWTRTWQEIAHRALEVLAEARGPFD